MSKLEKVCSGIDQLGDALARRQPALLVLRFDGFRAAALADFLFFILDFGEEVNHRARILFRNQPNRAQREFPIQSLPSVFPLRFESSVRLRSIRRSKAARECVFSGASRHHDGFINELHRLDDSREQGIISASSARISRPVVINSIAVLLPRGAEQRWQTLCASPPRDNSKSCAAMREHGIRCANA